METSKKKIAFYINSLGKGGAERVVVNLSNHFIQKGYEVVLVTSRYQADEYEQPAGSRRIISEIITPGTMNPFTYLYKRFRYIRQIWKDEKPDRLVCFIGKCNVIGLLTSCGLGIPVYVSVRSDPKQEYASGVMHFLSKTLFAKAQGIIVQTQEAKQYFPGYLQKKTVVLPNSLDEKFIQERFNGKRKDEIVSVGRLDENKNQKMLIQAFAGIAGDYPTMKLKIYGAGNQNGDTLPELEKQVKELELTDKVFFMGRRSDIAEQISQSRIYALTSNYEGMPNALLEAMSLGLACISTDCPCGGPRTVIQDGENGILIPVHDTQALEKALRKILENPDLEERLGVNAHHIGEELSTEKVNAAWEELIMS